MVASSKTVRPLAKVKAPAVLECPITKLKPHPHNPRGEVTPDDVQELADSIKRKGVIDPLIVVEDGDHYLIVCGIGAAWPLSSPV